MFQYWWLLIIVAVVAAAAAALLWRPKVQRPSRATPLSQAKRRFHVQRERLEAKFLQLASARIGPDAPRWADCDFDDDVAYVRSRTTGELSAFVAMTLATEDTEEATETSDEFLPGNLQAGTAVFRFDRDHWETDGRAILNLSPSEAINHFSDDLEIVSEDFAHRA